MKKIEIHMNDGDFEQLAVTSMGWAGHDWSAQSHRFENWTPGKAFTEEPRWDWRMAYWLGENYTTLILAKSYLAAIGEPFEVLWDLAENPDMSYVLVTNFVSPAWGHWESA